jgi:divinyl protochlorophyllide a 8-vinyl-reductase
MVASDARANDRDRILGARPRSQRRAGPGRIGPNSMTRVAQALRDEGGEPTARKVFEHAALLAWLVDPPTEMIDESVVRRLHVAMREVLGPDGSGRIAREAGAATADYLLEHRIPSLAQTVLKHLPAVLAERLLLAAVSRHAWTFAGSGRFATALGTPAVVEIVDNPLCRAVASHAPVCHFHAATFERLWRVLVADETRVVETACCACGAPACRFELRRGR